jgi:hypothetical protein
VRSATCGGARDLAAPGCEGVCALAGAPMNLRHPRERRESNYSGAERMRPADPFLRVLNRPLLPCPRAWPRALARTPSNRANERARRSDALGRRMAEERARGSSLELCARRARRAIQACAQVAGNGHQPPRHPSWEVSVEPTGVPMDQPTGARPHLHTAAPASIPGDPRKAPPGCHVRAVHVS